MPKSRIGDQTQIRLTARLDTADRVTRYRVGWPFTRKPVLPDALL